MSNYLAQGTWPCTVLSASAGEEIDQAGNPTGVIKARIAVKIEDGPSKGRTATYEDEINAKSSLYVMRSLKACGWTGPNLDTVSADVEKWVKETGGKSSVEIKHIEIKKGKKFDKWVADGRKGEAPVWDKVHAIGRGPKPLAAPSKSALNDANEAMRAAFALEGGGGGGSETPPDDDAIPFISNSMYFDMRKAGL